MSPASIKSSSRRRRPNLKERAQSSSFKFLHFPQSSRVRQQNRSEFFFLSVESDALTSQLTPFRCWVCYSFLRLYVFPRLGEVVGKRFERGGGWACWSSRLGSNGGAKKVSPFAPRACKLLQKWWQLSTVETPKCILGVGETPEGWQCRSDIWWRIRLKRFFFSEFWHALTRFEPIKGKSGEPVKVTPCHGAHLGDSSGGEEVRRSYRITGRPCSSKPFVERPSRISAWVLKINI